jgi:glyoxylase-like metal-dependent hydrolase (beta-lactamase superfamily II)
MSVLITSGTKWRIWHVGLMVIVLGVAALFVGAVHQTGWESFRRRGSQAPRLVPSAARLAPGVYILGALKPSVAYVVETPEGLVLIDSGLEEDATLLKSQMAELGLDWRALRAILLTHAHGDHCGGAQYLRAKTGARVYAGMGDAAVLSAGEPQEAFFSTFFMPNDTPHPTTVDALLQGGESIAIGDVRFQALATPGHTPGSICYLMVKDKLRVLFAGDVISMLVGSDDPLDRVGKPLGTYSAYLAPRYRGNAQEYLASLRELRALPIPDLVLPGHPAGDLTPQSPHLPQQRWEALLDDGIREMEILVARYETDGPDFLDGEPKPLLPDLYYLGDFEGTAVYGFFASSKFFLVDAPGGPGLAEFVKSRLRQLGQKPSEPAAVLLTARPAGKTGGFEELVKQCHVQVVASPEGLKSLKESCPDGTVVVSASDLPSRGWFEVRPIPLAGWRHAPIAYEITLAGKTVLFSGRVPTKLSARALAGLMPLIATSKSDMRDYSTSLTQLRSRKPDLWLPAIPTDGQNANLYDGEWERVIEENVNLINSAWSRINVK